MHYVVSATGLSGSTITAESGAIISMVMFARAQAPLLLVAFRSLTSRSKGIPRRKIAQQSLHPIISLPFPHQIPFFVHSPPKNEYSNSSHAVPAHSLQTPYPPLSVM
jgi:hypothetical protein